MHVKDLAARYEALISSEPPTPPPSAARPARPPSPQPAPPSPKPLSGPGTVSKLTRRIEAVVSIAAAPIPTPTNAAADSSHELVSSQRIISSTPSLSPPSSTILPARPVTSSPSLSPPSSTPPRNTISNPFPKLQWPPAPASNKTNPDSSPAFIPHPSPLPLPERESPDLSAHSDLIPLPRPGGLEDIEGAEPVSDGSIDHDIMDLSHIHPDLSSDPLQSMSPSLSPSQPSSFHAAPPPHLPSLSSLGRATSLSPDIRAMSPDIRVIASPLFLLDEFFPPEDATTSPPSSVSFHSPTQSFSRLDDLPSLVLHPAAARRPRSTSPPPFPPPSRPPSLPASFTPSFAPRSSTPQSSSQAPSSEGTLDPSSNPSRLLTATPSLKKLPKAKVILARRRPDPLSNASVDGRKRLSPSNSARHSLDMPSGRRLVREYSHPRELFAGHVSLLPSTPPESPPPQEMVSKPIISPGSQPTPFRPHSQPATSVQSSHPNTVLATRVAPPVARKALKNRYDDFMDPDDLPGRRHRDRDEELAADGFPAVSNSKKRYHNKKRLFGTNDEKEKERRRAERNERVERTSSVISGALDRVSMAADPWIDFITDANGVGVPNKTAGPLRRAMKRLFGKRGHAGLIKDHE